MLYIGLFGVSFIVAVACVLFWRQISTYLNKPDPTQTGNFVAEIWLEWSICTGSTMYRQRFETEQEAVSTVKRYAQMLDDFLPTTYRTRERKREKYDFGIKYAVRPISDKEVDSFKPIWTTVLPGYASHTGELAVNHPVYNTIDGMKI